MLSPSARGNENLLCLAPRLVVTKLVMLSPSASEEVGEEILGKLFHGEVTTLLFSAVIRRRGLTCLKGAEHSLRRGGLAFGSVAQLRLGIGAIRSRHTA